MPRAQRPEIYLALSIGSACASLAVPRSAVMAAIDAGLLEVRQLGNRKRISVFGQRGLQAWFETWPLATQSPAKRK
jgi:hypothetical protein